MNWALRPQYLGDDALYVPELRFPEFSEEWEEKKINELFEFLPTNSFSRANLNYESGKVRNIHYGDIHTKFPSCLDCERVEIPFINSDIELNKIKEESYCKNGDLVIADASEDYNDIGKAIELKNVNNNQLLAGLHTFLARDKSGLTVDGYRGYMLLNEDIKLQIKKIATGISVLGISKTNLGELKIRIPSIAEQEKIASFLSKVDEKIEKLKKKQELWETYKKGMMQKIFSQELRFTDENGEDYPDWEEKRLVDVSECLDNRRKPLNASDRLKIQGKIPYYGANGIVDYVKNYIFDEPLVLLAEDGGNFEEFQNRPIAQLVIGKSWVNNHAHVLRSGSDISIEFLFYSLVNKDIRKYINGTSRSKLNKKDMLSIQLKIPIIFEQKRIVKVFFSIDSKLNQIKKEIKINNEFKMGLLQQMFC